MSWEALKSAVSAVITDNGNNEITGPILEALINHNLIPQLGKMTEFLKTANPNTDPATSENSRMYIAYTSGIYANFSGIEIKENEVAILFNDTTNWQKIPFGTGTKNVFEKIVFLWLKTWHHPYNFKGFINSNSTEPASPINNDLYIAMEVSDYGWIQVTSEAMFVVYNEGVWVQRPIKLKESTLEIDKFIKLETKRDNNTNIFESTSDGLVLFDSGNTRDLNNILSNIEIRSNRLVKPNGDLRKVIISAIGNRSGFGHRFVVVAESDLGSFNTSSGAITIYDSGYKATNSELIDIDSYYNDGVTISSFKCQINWTEIASDWVGGIGLPTSSNPDYSHVLLETISGNSIKKARQSEFIDPRDFGAVYNGISDCTPAINYAITLGKKVRLIGNNATALCKSTIILGTNGVILEADPNFTVKLDNQVNDFLVKTPGADFAWDSPNVNSIVIERTGLVGGIWDCNGANQTRDFVNKTYVGFGIVIADVTDFKMQDLKIKNPCSFGFQGGGMRGFNINNIQCDYDNLRPNMDGIHVNGDCLDGYISDITGRTNDDMVALNAADGEEYQLRKGDIKRIHVRNISCSGGGYRAMRILNDNVQDVDEISIDGIYGTYDNGGAITISSYRGFGSLIKRVSMSNIKGKFGAPVIQFTEGTENCRILSLELNNISYKLESGRINGLLSSPSTIDKLSISNVHVDCGNIDVTSLDLIKTTSDGIIKDMTLNNFIVKTDYNRKIGTLINANYNNAVLNNLIIDVVTIINNQVSNSKMFENNCLFNFTNGVAGLNFARLKSFNIPVTNEPTAPVIGDIILKSDGLYQYKNGAFTAF